MPDHDSACADMANWNAELRVPIRQGIEGRLQLLGGRAEVSWALPGRAGRIRKTKKVWDQV